MNKIITIARQYGSNGHRVGHKLAEMLGIKCYDRELTIMAAERSGLNPDTLESVDEKAASSLLYTLVMGSNMYHSSSDHFNMPINDKLFRVQSEIMHELAQKESCIIVGRCADYVLADHKPCINVFVYADFDHRVKTVCERQGVTEAEARDLIVKNDKRRANYYNYYSGQKWGKLENYDLAVSTDMIGIDGAAKLIADYTAIACGE